ncbi:MAG: peptidase M20, partial [Verrucomicrobiota bacterium]
MDREIETAFDKNLERYLSEWKEFLKFPSISMEPEHADNCERCASWLNSHLESIGFSSRIVETSSHPLVFAEYAGDSSAPTVLYYGHY